MRWFNGKIAGEDLDIAMEHAEQIKPGAKNIYGRVCENNLELIVRKRVEDKIEEHVVHTIVAKPEEIIDRENVNMVNGFLFCISVPRYTKSISDGSERGISCQVGGFGGTCVACPVAGK